MGGIDHEHEEIERGPVGAGAVRRAGGLYQGVAVAGERSAAQMPRAARDDAAKASKALAKRNAGDAVRYAELAVSMQPQSADYRALLGQAYLLAGRFSSASTAFNDALSLSPGDGKVALNLALAQIAEGDWQGARRTLDSNSGSISVSDRGLALALAGDPVAAVDLMLPVARQPGADAKLRQNLALSLALAGRWQDAKMVAGMDLSPTETDKRLQEWAAFARPTGRADQVAALLGVSPAADPGQPVALALNAPAPVAVAAVAPTPMWPKRASCRSSRPLSPRRRAVVDPMVAPKPAVSGVVFAPRAEVVQPLPVKAVQPAVGVAPAKSREFRQTLVAATTTPGASKVSVRSRAISLSSSVPMTARALLAMAGHGPHALFRATRRSGHADHGRGQDLLPPVGRRLRRSRRQADVLELSRQGRALLRPRPARVISAAAWTKK